MSIVHKIYSETTGMKSEMTKAQIWEAEKKKTSERSLLFFVDYVEKRTFLLFVTTQPGHSFSSKLLAEHDLWHT